jgi:hypothetical protein
MFLGGGVVVGKHPVEGRFVQISCSPQHCCALTEKGILHLPTLYFFLHHICYRLPAVLGSTQLI